MQANNERLYLSGILPFDYKRTAADKFHGKLKIVDDLEIVELEADFLLHALKMTLNYGGVMLKVPGHLILMLCFQLLVQDRYECFFISEIGKVSGNLFIMDSIFRLPKSIATVSGNNCL